MVLGRNGLRDERRRRVLIDETLHGNGADASDDIASPAPESGRSRATTYAAAAQVKHHAPFSVCIPKRIVSVWGILLAGGCLIAGIELLYSEFYLRADDSLKPSLAALDVTARGSLAAWFSSIVLCCSALGSLVVYLIRRHRMDDYRGRYRWWLWLVPLLLIVSINAGTGLHQVLGALLTRFSGAEIAPGGKGWWLLAYGAVFLPVAAQLAVELWRGRLATMFYGISLAAYAAAASFELGAVRCAAERATVMSQSTLLLVGHFGVLLTILAFGRYVFLEAQNSLPKQQRGSPKKQPRGRQETAEAHPRGDGHRLAEASSAESNARVDGPHSRFAEQGAAAPHVVLSAADDEAGSDADRKLSKAERKRLRREAHRA